MMSLITFLTVIIATVNFVVGFLVLFKAKKNSQRWPFFILVVILNGWLLCNFISHIVSSHSAAVLLSSFTYLFGALIVPTFILFVYNFPTRSVFSKTRFVLLSIPAVIVGVLAFTTIFIRDVRVVPHSLNVYVNGPLLWLYSVVVGVYVAIYLTILYRKIKREKSTNRLKLQYIFIGFVVASGIGIFFDLIIPLFRTELAEGVYGSLGTIFISLSVTYAILRYRLLDIVVVIRKSLVQFVTFVLLFAIYAYALLLVQRSTSSTFTLSNNTSLLVTIFIIGLTIEPLRKGIYKFIDGIVANREKDRQEALKRMQLMAASTMQFQTLLDRTQQELGKTFGVQVDFLLAERRVQALTQFPAGQMKVQLEDVVGQRIAGGRVLIADELPYRIENGETSLKVVHDWMQANDVSAIVPIGAGEDMVGTFLFRGMGKVVYTADMVRFMKDFQEQSTFAFASAYAYKLAVERIGVRQ